MLAIPGGCAVHSAPTFITNRCAAADSGLTGRSLAGIGVGTGGHISLKIVVSEDVLALLQAFQIGGQFASAQGWSFLDPNMVL